MGKWIVDQLPSIVKAKVENNLNLIWMIDPMHGNTYVSENNFKCRNCEDIMEEILNCFVILNNHSEKLQGLHLETTPLEVSECSGFNIKEEDLGKVYLTACDPRLNPH